MSSITDRTKRKKKRMRKNKIPNSNWTVTLRSNCKKMMKAHLKEKKKKKMIMTMMMMMEMVSIIAMRTLMKKKKRKNLMKKMMRTQRIPQGKTSGLALIKSPKDELPKHNDPIS